MNLNSKYPTPHSESSFPTLSSFAPYSHPQVSKLEAALCHWILSSSSRRTGKRLPLSPPLNSFLTNFPPLGLPITSPAQNLIICHLKLSALNFQSILLTAPGFILSPNRMALLLKHLLPHHLLSVVWLPVFTVIPCCPPTFTLQPRQAVYRSLKLQNTLHTSLALLMLFPPLKMPQLSVSNS